MPYDNAYQLLMTIFLILSISHWIVDAKWRAYRPVIRLGYTIAMLLICGVFVYLQYANLSERSYMFYTFIFVFIFLIGAIIKFILDVQKWKKNRGVAS